MAEAGGIERLVLFLRVLQDHDLDPVVKGCYCIAETRFTRTITALADSVSVEFLFCSSIV
jgi:hypothetical protein